MSNHDADSCAAQSDTIHLCREAISKDDAALLQRLLREHPELKARINDPIGPFDSPAIIHARSREMLDVLLAGGADINARSRWWAGSFGLLDNARPDLAAYAIQRGAVITAHATARLAMLDKLRELVSANPDLVNARGGDGQTPLHFASTIEIAKYLLDNGADIEARDIDHESTPAQYMVRDRQEVLRYLIQLGCKTDIFMASALGDADLVRRHLDADPECIRVRVSDQFFPKTNPKSGGHIYHWMLGFHVSPHDVAKQFRHEEVFQLLMQRSPADIKLLAACWAGDEAAMKSLLSDHPDVVRTLLDVYGRQIADAARNNNVAAVRLMLAAGLPVDARGQHGGTPLHWAAFHGNAEMAREILRYNPPLELLDHDFRATPLGWAIHGSEHGWYCRTGDYAGTVEALLKAGAKLPDKIKGSGAVKEVLMRYQHNSSGDL